MLKTPFGNLMVYKNNTEIPYRVNPQALKVIQKTNYYVDALISLIQNAINSYPLRGNVFEYINDHVKENITLNTLVETCNISQGYLSRIIKNQFRTSVME